MKMNRVKWINLGILLSSFLGYLEWGGDNQQLLGSMEWEVIYKAFRKDQNIMHPLIILPMLGQLLLLLSIFQKRVSKAQIYTAISCLGILIGFIAIIGLMSLTLSIFSSTLPFFFFVFLAIREQRKLRVQL